MTMFSLKQNTADMNRKILENIIPHLTDIQSIVCMMIGPGPIPAATPM